MLRLVLVFCTAMLLSGCLPLSFFASSKGYGGYQQKWGTYVSHSKVDAFCISPKLRVAIMDFEGHFGRKIVMSSGYRNPFYNEKVGGADNSYHTKCMAADFFMPGVDKRKLIAYALRNGNGGGLGCYPVRYSSTSTFGTVRGAGASR